MKFLICDVFSRRAFAGNPLAVVFAEPDTPTERLQQIAREFNFSETSFVLGPVQRAGTRVRIFTPSREVPFAGHPNIGTALMLAETGCWGEIGAGIDVVFDEAAGLVPIHIEPGETGLRATLVAPQPLSVANGPPLSEVAAALCLAESDLVGPAPVISVGLAFVCAQLASREALARARPNAAVSAEWPAQGWPSAVFAVYQADSERCASRMFDPLDGMVEDPATGSASGAFAAWRWHIAGGLETLRLAFDQGEDMGRPSRIDVMVDRDPLGTPRVRVSGSAVCIAEGVLR